MAYKNTTTMLNGTAPSDARTIDLVNGAAEILAELEARFGRADDGLSERILGMREAMDHVELLIEDYVPETDLPSTPEAA